MLQKVKKEDFEKLDQVSKDRLVKGFRINSHKQNEETKCNINARYS